MDYRCISRVTNEVRLQVTRQRNANILTNFVLNNINENSIICSDEYRGYIKISNS